MGFGGLALRLPEAGEAGSGAEFPRLGGLGLGDLSSILVTSLGLGLLFVRLCQEQVSFEGMMRWSHIVGQFGSAVKVYSVA